MFHWWNADLRFSPWTHGEDETSKLATLVRMRLFCEKFMVFSAGSELTGLVVCPRPAVQHWLWQNKYCSCVMLGQKRQGEHYFQERAWSAAVPHHQVTPTWSAEWEWHLSANESCLHGPQGSTGSPAPAIFNAVLYNGAGRDIHVISRPSVTEFQIWE